HRHRARRRRRLVGRPPRTRAARKRPRVPRLRLHVSFDLDEVDRLLTTTKAVRQRLDLARPVPRELITECIRVGCYAPNASNAQEWWWVVIDDADQKVRVA